MPNRLSRTAAATAPQELPQGVSPRVKASTRLGHLNGDTQLASISLVLAPSAAQSAALDQLLADQQNPAAPRYHQWLTPAQFGAQFGVSDADLQVLQNWLTNQGFQITEVAPSRNRITFSGSAATVEAAFHTELDTFRRGDQQFFENGTAPQIPSALQNVVSAITGLSSYRLRPALHRVVSANSGSLAGQRPNNTSATGSHYVTPWDFRQIYNANGLFNSGYTGNGIKIAVLGQSAVDLNQLTYFQQLTGQTPKAPTVVLVPNTGVSTAYQGDETESEADLEYASGVAPGASVTFVYAGSATNADVTTALNYAITNNLAPILTYSYGGCETENSLAALVGQEAAFRQANAQGQTILVSAGDTGAAGCEDVGVTTAYDGLQVSYPASSPYVTAVGGTQFNDTTNGSTYWSGSNNGQYGSAIGYIPESVWNENSSDPLSAGGGGASRVFGKPNWQVANGVPSDGARDIPDVSFTASEHDAYLICTSDSSFVSGSSTGACTSTAFGIGRVGGTSLPTPAFAGALAMILSANNNTTGMGNLNPLLYSLFGTTPSVFHDITSGNNNDPCATGTLGCVNGTLGYSAAAGYDLASGLGSLDLGAFSGNFNTTLAVTGRTPTLALTVTTANTTSITVAVRASSNTSTTVPTGSVTVSLDGGSPQTVALGSIPVGGATGTPGLATVTFTGTYATGTHTINATYAGDTNFSGATASTTLSVSTTNGGLTLAATPTTVTINSSTAHSGTWTLNLTSINGYSGIVGINQPVAASGSNLPTVGCFIGQGDVGIAANASVSTTITYSFSSVDCSGANVIKVFGDTRKAIAAARKTSPLSGTHNLPLLAVSFTGLLGSAFLRRKRAWMTGLLALAAMAGTFGLSGCGSGSAPLSTTTTGGSGTVSAPKGTYNVVFSASDYVNNSPSATVNVTLVIQ
ncbi:hypothetical protein GCM10022270_08870 [Terriglobus aquaticus]